MELPSKTLEQITFNTRNKIEEHMLIVMNKPTHEEPLFHPLQTDNKQCKISVTFLTDYIRILNLTGKKNSTSRNQFLTVILYKLLNLLLLLNLKV